MEEDAVLSAGLGVMDQLIRGEYDGVYEELRSDVRDATTASALEDVMDTATDGLGEPKEVTDTMVTGVTDTDEPHAIAVIRRKYEKKSVYFRIAFDPDMQLIGMEIKKNKTKNLSYKGEINNVPSCLRPQRAERDVPPLL